MDNALVIPVSYLAYLLARMILSTDSFTMHSRPSSKLTRRLQQMQEFACDSDWNSNCRPRCSVIGGTSVVFGWLHFSAPTCSS
jgi:hypothetical protein